MKQTTRILKAHRILLYLTTIGLAVYGMMAIFDPEILASGFSRFTKFDWQGFRNGQPAVATYVTFLWRLIGAFNLAAGLTLTLLTWKWFVPGRPWAWVTLLAGTSIAYLSPMSMDLTVKSIELLEVVEFALFGLFLMTMFIVRKEYATRSRMTGQP